MVLNGYENGNTTPPNSPNSPSIKPTYAVEHLATFKIKNEGEIKRPKDKLKTLVELDKTGGVWPMKMFMCFSGQWLLMLDSAMKEIENFPGALITEPTAFISEDPMEIFNNILIFTVPGASLGNSEMHIFQVCDVSAVHMVEDLRDLSTGNLVTIDRNKTPIILPKSDKSLHVVRDHYGIAVAAAEVAAEKNAHDQEQTAKDVQVLNHCFEDIERFVVRLQYAVEALRELEQRSTEHNSHGEGLLITRSRPPTESEFIDILAKHKLALNYIAKLESHFQDPAEPIHNSFVSLQTIVNVCNDVYVDAQIVENVINPLFRRETITILNNNLNDKELTFWKSLGPNWSLSKDQFFDHKGAYHPKFYDDWTPDWIVDEEVPHAVSPTTNRLSHTNSLASPGLGYNATWLSRLKSRNVKIAEVIYNKVASNDKELNVAKGEHLEIIDDSRNWWKARNAAGNIGYVPHTILSPLNFEKNTVYGGRDTDSLNSAVFENDRQNGNHRNTLSIYAAPSENEFQSYQTRRTSIPRSYSMPNVPVPPPMPPPSDPNTPTGTMKRNMAVTGAIAAMRARNNCETEDEALMLQSSINDELKVTLMQREKRKDLEILKTPQIYINQNSSSKEVEEWLRGKGFSDVIIRKLCGLNGEKLFALSPHVIEGYFGQKESRRLISQIVLQKNICEYKTVRSSELSAKLARARQKADDRGFNTNEVF